METFFAPCPRGLEGLLVHEFETMGGGHIRPASGGVECRGPFSLCYRMNLKSRLAARILWRVGSGTYRNEQDLYRLTFELPWHEHFRAACRIKVKIVAHHCSLKSLDFATLRIKDGICDRFVKEVGRRPTVHRQQPDIPIVVFLEGDQVVWYVDTSGAPLFKRGWRKAAGEAPIRENLAAGILQLAGWTPEQVLLDPMCGAGTFLIEAALMAKGIPPGSGRNFAFSELNNFDPSAWARVLGASTHSSAPKLALYGCDREAPALDMARGNSQGLGLSDIHWTQEDVLNLNPPAERGIVLTNPPYGVRMGNHAELEDWYPRFGNMLKQRFAGWSVFVFTADLRAPKLIRLAPSRKIPLWNGPLESRLYEFRMVPGGNRKAVRLIRNSEERAKV